MIGLIEYMKVPLEEPQNLRQTIKDAIKLKKRVRLTGDLFHSSNGHHHSRVLMSVKKLEELKCQENSHQMDFRWTSEKQRAPEAISGALLTL